RLPYYLSLQVRVCRKLGSIEQGLALVDEALAESRANDERWWDAELFRLRGELLLAHGADDEGQAALTQALEVARVQEAKSLELRAATSLAPVWQARGRKGDARRLLGDVFGWFTEGFETPDLRWARALLAQLA